MTQQGIGSLRTHEKMPQDLKCPCPTCECHTGKGFKKEEELEGHVRLQHPKLSFSSLA